MDRDPETDSTYSMKISSDSETGESDQESSEEWFAAQYEEVPTKKNARLCKNDSFFDIDPMSAKRVKTVPDKKPTSLDEVEAEKVEEVKPHTKFADNTDERSTQKSSEKFDWK